MSSVVISRMLGRFGVGAGPSTGPDEDATEDASAADRVPCTASWTPAGTRVSSRTTAVRPAQW